VVNYELPNVPEDYVHRIGRTGRAGNEGQAVSLVCVDELKLLRDIERLLKREIPKQVLAGYEPDPNIKAEPIKMGRGGGGGRSQSRGQGGQAARQDRSPDKRKPARRETAAAPAAKAGEGRRDSKPVHKHVRRKPAEAKANPQHRHPRNGKSAERPALLGGHFKDD
jgi:ATP-dependent RNA helicase RhlE